MSNSRVRPAVLFKMVESVLALMATVTTTSPAEFTLARRHTTDRRTPVRWVISHALRYWWLILIMFIGAIGNAAMSAYVPILTGDAFNAMLKVPPEVKVLLPLALIMGG